MIFKKNYILLFQVTGIIVIHSRISEINYEITYGEKKNIDPYSSRATLINSAIQSGANTPVPRGVRTAASNYPPQSQSSYA